MRTVKREEVMPNPSGRTLVRSLALVVFFAAAGAPGPAAQDAPPRPYHEAVDRMRGIGLLEEKAYEFLGRITAVGPRLTGSPQADRAVEVSLRIMEELGFENVHTEPVTVGRWVRGDVEEASIVGPNGGEDVPLQACALGGSVPTPAAGLVAPVVEVRSFEELARLGASVKGKIVFYNRPMDRTLLDTFGAYGKAADQRVRGASEAARFGAVAALVRSLTLRVNDHPHTGLMQYEQGVTKIPAAAVSTAGADRLSGLLEENPELRLRLRMDCRTEKPVVSANVVGEITGSELPKEIVLVGGHLDSWDLGTGAHDDGAGCAVSLEALRLIKAAGLRPRRTVRAVLFMDEEFGGTGGRAYAHAPQRRGERHLFAAESDRGGFLPVGLAAGGGSRAALERIKTYEDLFKPLGILFISPGGGGVDIGPLVEQGTVPAAVILNAQTYFDVHHSALDVLSRVHPRELELQAVVLAALAYLVAQEGL
ncbi:MAG: M20/M25/M40 family metallo-hydrolase [Candidatus Aminicenantes bacterium]